MTDEGQREMPAKPVTSSRGRMSHGGSEEGDPEPAFPRPSRRAPGSEEQLLETQRWGAPQPLLAWRPHVTAKALSRLMPELLKDDEQR